MGDATARLATRLEITKLAHELDLGTDELAFLADADADELKALRQDVANALYRRHEARFARVAALSSMVPTTVAARAAQVALGPVLSARIAAALDPDEAVKLASRVPTDFLADLALSLDPERSAAIVRRLDDELVVRVGRVLMDRGEALVLGRFVSVVEPTIALRLVEGGEPGVLLDTALLADDRSVLPALVGGLDDDALAGVLVQAHADGRAEDAVTLLTALDAPTRQRVVSLVAGRSLDEVSGFLQAVQEVGAWPEVVPALVHLDDAVLARLVNVPATADPAVLDAVHAAATDGPEEHPRLLARLVLQLDEAHLAALRSTSALGDPAARERLVATAGDDADRVRDLLAGPGAS